MRPSCRSGGWAAMRSPSSRTCCQWPAQTIAGARRFTGALRAALPSAGGTSCTACARRTSECEEGWCPRALPARSASGSGTLG
eukprot:2156497-Alexandrium_andersonii.AAC.1